MTAPGPSGGVPSVQDAAAHRRVMAARIVAQKRWPYVSAMLYSLHLVEVDADQLPTMAVDRGWRLYYCADFVLGCEVDQLATVLLHECQHLMLNHARRFEALRQPPGLHRWWNIAADAVINEGLDEAEMPWPEARGIRYSDLAHLGVEPGMAAEPAYFAMLRNADGGSGSESGDSSADGPLRAGERDSPQPGGTAGGSGSGGEPGSAEPGADLSVPGTGADLQGAPGGIAAGDCGGAAGGGTRPYEISESDEAAPAVDRPRRDLVRDKVAQSILERGRSHGDVPQGLARWAQERLEPVVDWRSVLAGLVRSGLAVQVGRRDYSYRFPSRRAEGLRSALGGAVLPAMRQPPPPTVAAVIDTSGSIDNEQIARFVAEVLGIVRAAGIREGVTVIPCDAQAYDPFRIRRRGDLRDLELHGGGGTDMGKGLQAACELRPLPDVVIVFTDGFTRWPTRAPHPSPKFVVAVTEGGAPMSRMPQWADGLSVPDSEQVIPESVTRVVPRDSS